MRILSAVLLSLAVAAFADDQNQKKNDPNQIGSRDVGKGVNFYTFEKEIALGKQLAQEVERQTKPVDDPLISELVNRIGQNLVRNSDAKVPFTFKVIQDDAPNAFALPGGFVFVNTGLLKMADEEDEFAGALAHEIAHVAARHMTRQATKSQIASVSTIPLTVLLGGLGGYAARQAANAVLPLTFLKFSRADESEADFLGVQYMYAAGYDPNGAISIFEKLESLQLNKPGFGSKMLSTHPLDADRISKTQAEIGKILPAKADYVVTTSEYAAIRQRLLNAESGRKPDDKSNRPTLRRANPDGKTEPDERPTIKRRDLID